MTTKLKETDLSGIMRSDCTSNERTYMQKWKIFLTVGYLKQL